MNKKVLVILYILITLAMLCLIISIFMLLAVSDARVIQHSDYKSVNKGYAEEVTETEPATEKPDVLDNITFNFMGDCTLGTLCGAFTEGKFNATAENVEPEYFFEGVREVLNEGTFNITNCEGVLTDNPLEEIYKDYSPAFWFKSPAKNARIFSVNDICAVGIANNHINDYGEQGITDTKKALEDNDVIWGDNTNPIMLEKDGIKIVVFIFTLWGYEDMDTLCSQIEEYSDTTDLQIVFFHGGTEAIHYPDQYKINDAHMFVDAGADLVVGAHPHVLQPIEVYNGVNIVYSIGNFVFGGNSRPENRTIVYQHTFNFKNKEFVDSKEKIYPCYIYTGDVNEFQPVLMDDDDPHKQEVIDFMYGKTDSPL